MSDIVERPKTARPDRTDAPDEVPIFGSEAEAREFWATHDSAPYCGRMEDASATPPAELAVGPGRAGSTARRRPR